MELSIRKKTYNPGHDSIDKKCKILIIGAYDISFLEKKEIFFIFNKVFYLEKELYEIYKKEIIDYEALIIINDGKEKNFELINDLLEIYKNINIKIKIYCEYKKDKSLTEKHILKKEIKNISNKNGFKLFEYFYDSCYYDINNIYKYIVTELYRNYFSNEENWKLYKLNILFKQLFNKEIEKGYFISEINTLIEKCNKFEEFNINENDENKILIDTFNIYSKQNKNYTLNEFLDIINELNITLKKDFIISNLLNNIICQGKFSK